MRTNLKERAIRPHGGAALLATFYVAVSVVYIVTSTHVAAVAAQSGEQLERLERMKGVLFVLGTGVLFYVVALLLLLRVKR